ncbi:MAG: hypothetical protein Q7K26_01470 [bacterium]|nr:hypothetical protein [bacterium]
MISSRLRVRSPKKVDAHLSVLLRYLELSEQSVVSLKYKKPDHFLPEGAMCHFNAWLKWEKDEGSVQAGWILGQDKNAQFCEAIFHSVWKSPNGDLIDVTPRQDQEKRILFVPDHIRHIELTEHNGHPAINTYDNVRLQGEHLITPLTPMLAVMESDFVHIHKLWPW